MQVELPKAQETQKFKDGFDLEIFITENWFYLLSVLIIVALVVMHYKRQQSRSQD